MTFEQAMEIINKRLPLELEQARKWENGHPTYICPLCSNGSGKDGTGISTKDGKSYKCFVCGFYGDYCDLLIKKHNAEGIKDIFKLYKLQVDYKPKTLITRRNAAVTREQNDDAQRAREDKKLMNELKSYFESCRAKAGATDYFSERGISAEVVKRMGVGFDPKWHHPKTPCFVSERVILPTGVGLGYTARVANFDDDKYSKQKSGEKGLFNLDGLHDEDYPYIFIVEGEFDALSVIEVGGQAVALSGVANTTLFVETVKKSPPSVPLALSLDNDTEGRKAQAVLKEHLKDLNIPFIEVNISGEQTDPNDALVFDRSRFAKMVLDPTQKGDTKVTYVQAKSVSSSLDDFMLTIKADKPRVEAIPTGFDGFDKVLDGGFYDGLYIMGAGSTIGKTTKCLQIADSVAQQGTDVLIFSLEMNKHTLISKSFSRLTFVEDKEKDKKTGNFYARTSRQILTGAFEGEREKMLVDNALQQYRQFSQHLYIYDGMGGITVERIRQTVSDHVQATGSRPLVIVDYLQILSPNKPTGSDKQNIDNAVMELKQLSMKYQIPILAVSSFNRMSYDAPVNMASFKESGAIEYSSDVLLGLQYKGIDELTPSDSRKKLDEWRSADCRELELKILKNRNGASGDSIYFNYYPKFNLFHEAGKR